MITITTPPAVFNPQPVRSDPLISIMHLSMSSRAGRFISFERFLRNRSDRRASPLQLGQLSFRIVAHGKWQQGRSIRTLISRDHVRSGEVEKDCRVLFRELSQRNQSVFQVSTVQHLQVGRQI
jgi:hypothetical protein